MEQASWAYKSTNVLDHRIDQELFVEQLNIAPRCRRLSGIEYRGKSKTQSVGMLDKAKVLARGATE